MWLAVGLRAGKGERGAAPGRGEGEQAAGDEPGLEGRRILVVEDEFLLALEVEAALTSFGCFVAGPFAKLGKALVAARATRLDGAVLDINLNGEMVYPLAEFLDMAGVPFRLPDRLCVLRPARTLPPLPKAAEAPARGEAPAHYPGYAARRKAAGRVKPGRNRVRRNTSRLKSR